MHLKRILVCDDDEGILEVTKIILENGGFEVEILNNGRGIKKKIQSFTPHLILLDIWMAGIEGKEVAKMLKRDDTFKKIPIIFISALQEVEIKKIVKEVGVENFLTKPFEMSDLLEIAQKYTTSDDI